MPLTEASGMRCGPGQLEFVLWVYALFRTSGKFKGIALLIEPQTRLFRLPQYMACPRLSLNPTTLNPNPSPTY